MSIELCVICRKDYELCGHSATDVKNHRSKKEFGVSDLEKKVEALEKRIKSLENRLEGVTLLRKFK